MKSEQKKEVLRNCTFLAGLQDSILASLADHSSILDLEPQTPILTKGEDGSNMFFIASGRVRVHDGEVVLAYLGTGHVFGEMAVLDSGVRSASVTSEKRTLMLCLEREDLWHVVAQSPDSLRIIIASVLQRERDIVKDVTTRTAQLQAFEKELEIGRRIQADFLPEYIPEVENWEIASCFEAAREVSGDFFDVFEFGPDGYIALVIGDVCDKGVGAALFMTLFRSLIRATCQLGALKHQVASKESSQDHIRQVLQTSIDSTNRYIATTHSKSSMFASVFFGVLETDSGKMIYINAGHESPVIFKRKGDPVILERTGGVLGLFDFARYNIAATQLEKDDLLFSYTDGVNEAKNEAGEQFSDNRILQAGASGWSDAQGLLDNVLSQIKEFRGRAAQSDDITMLAIACLGKSRDKAKSLV